jgi:CheY-like chemotaxis protein
VNWLKRLSDRRCCQFGSRVGRFAPHALTHREENACLGRISSRSPGIQIRGIKQLASGETMPPRESVRRETERPHRRFLLIDDDPLILDCLADLLRGDGVEVCIALDGLSGIEKFCRAIVDDAPFDAVIADLEMPVLDGRDVVERVRLISPGTRTVLLTGRGEIANKHVDASRQPDCVVAKPVRIEELRHALCMG